MRQISFHFTLGAMLFALCFSAQAQLPGKILRIGFLSRELHPSDSRAVGASRLEAFRQGLRELGYIEDKTILIEYRYADARPERLPALAQELVRLKVEIIVADTTLVARAARKVTSTIPIVFLSGSDPTQTGLCGQFGSPRRQCYGFDKLLRGAAREAARIDERGPPQSNSLCSP
jgi:putative tryptophan/tyrosine transport system substrate-binding protein